jgi:hypothetical protein
MSVENYVSKAGLQTGNGMKRILFELLLTRYRVADKTDHAEKLAASVVNYLFCETADNAELRSFSEESNVVVDCLADLLAHFVEHICRGAGVFNRRSRPKRAIPSAIQAAILEIDELIKSVIRRVCNGAPENTGRLAHFFVQIENCAAHNACSCIRLPINCASFKVAYLGDGSESCLDDICRGIAEPGPRNGGEIFKGIQRVPSKCLQTGLLRVQFLREGGHLNVFRRADHYHASSSKDS